MNMVPAERLFQMITGFAVSQAIYVAAKLGIADLLKDGPKGSDELAQSAPADGDALSRLLRFLASVGIFAECQDGRFKLTPLAECLQTENPAAMRTWAIYWGENWIWRPWGELLYSVKTGLPAFDHIYGAGPFDYFAGNPEAADIFRRAMRAQTEIASAAVVAAYDFTGISNIVDVGGDDGSFLAAVLQANPGTRGIVFDRPYAIDKARTLIEAEKVGDRCELVAGDFFESVPTDGNIYILKLIIHDWDDNRAITILRNCHRVMTESDRILVIEHVIRPGNEPDIGKLMDVHMLVRQLGRERTESEYRDLFTAAGFKLTRIVPTRSQVSIIEGAPDSRNRHDLELPHRNQDGTYRAGPTDLFNAFKKADIEQSISDRFEQQVRKYPHRLAVKTKNYALTYDDLNQAANRVARLILEIRGKGEEPIALLLEKDAPMIAVILGVLKAGKIYVPLDPSFPQARIQAMLKDSQAGLMITNGRHLSLAERMGHCRWINLDELDPSLSPENLCLPLSSDTVAYLLYTSGSTGEPKGVVQSHQNILHKTMTYTNDLNFWRGDRILLLSPFTFSLSVGFIFGALLNGACLYPVEIREEGLKSLADWLIQEDITVYNSVPTVFRNFVDSLTDEKTFPKLRLIHLGGQGVTAKDVELYKKHFSSGCILVHHMGSNETGTIGQYIIDKATPIDGGIVPAGYPEQDAEVLVLDDAGGAVGLNEIGEIAVKSRYLSPGYWRKPELTRTVFLPDPAGGEGKIFRTGDLGRVRSDGCLEYLGRKDLQVKVRGQKVEILEIEQALLDVDTVKEAVVVAQEEVCGSPRLVAYVVFNKDQASTTNELRRFLRAMLPEYMVPASFVPVRAIPLSPNGKVDRRALHVLYGHDSQEEKKYVPPRDETERVLCRVWSEVLGLDHVGIDDDFFALGGHSLLAAKLFTRLDEEFGSLFPIGVLFTAPTVRLLAEKYRASPASKTGALIVPLRNSGALPPIYGVPGVFGNVVGFEDLTSKLGSEQPFYGLQSVGLDGAEAPLDSMEAIASRYLEEIRSFQPQGPYALIGACFGATVVYEMTRQLLSAGEEVVFLGLLDPPRREGWAQNENALASRRVITRAATLGVLVSGRLHLYLEEMINLNLSDRLKFVAKKLYAFVGSLVQRHGLKGVQRELYQIGVCQANVRALERYQKTPLNGRLRTLEVFETPRRGHTTPSELPKWSALWRGPISLHAVPGKDSADMMSGNNANVLAALLAQRLRAAFDQEAR